MKILALADTHISAPSELELLESHLRPYVDEAEAFIHVGDCVVAEVIQWLKDLGPAYFVVGNSDNPDLRWANPSRLTIEVGGVRIGLIHGRGPTEGVPMLARSSFDDVQVIVFGHAHRPFLDWLGGVLVICPGTIFGGPPLETAEWNPKEQEDVATVALIETHPLGASIIRLPIWD